MAKFEREGYCPNNDVSEVLRTNDDIDIRLHGLWSLIGPSVVCVQDDAAAVAKWDDVVDIFTIDPITYHLMDKLIRYESDANKIAVKQIWNGACNTQCYSDIQKVLMQAVEPQLVIHSGSRFAAVITSMNYGIDLYIWDLTNCR